MQTTPKIKQAAGSRRSPASCSGSSEYPDRIEETWRADAGWQRADAAEAKLAMIHEKAHAALQTSWLYSGKDHVEKLMREIAAISSENKEL